MFHANEPDEIKNTMCDRSAVCLVEMYATLVIKTTTLLILYPQVSTERATTTSWHVRQTQHTFRKFDVRNGRVSERSKPYHTHLRLFPEICIRIWMCVCMYFPPFFIPYPRHKQAFIGQGVLGMSKTYFVPQNADDGRMHVCEWWPAADYFPE